MYCSGRPAPTRGALRGRHGRWERDAVDAASAHASAQTNGAEADGEVVWSWRPDAGAKFSQGTIPAKVTVAKEPGHRGDHV